jgi:hypothetical protein
VPKYRKNKFLFGESTRIPKEGIAALLKQIMEKKDDAGEFYGVILVGFGMSRDLMALKSAGIDFRNPNEFPSIVRILDLSSLSRAMFRR